MDIVYRPELSWKEQAKRDLKYLIKEYKKRVSSSKKMQKELEKAARENAKELKILQQEAEKEEKRKEEARRRRKIRLQSAEEGNTAMARVSEQVLTTNQHQEDDENLPATVEGKSLNEVGQDKEKPNRDELEESYPTNTDELMNEEPGTALRAEPSLVFENESCGSDTMFSAARPRNLLSAFSVSNKEVSLSQISGSSAQKKVRWVEDEKKISSQNRRDSSYSHSSEAKGNKTSHGRGVFSTKPPMSKSSGHKSAIKVAQSDKTARAGKGKSTSSRRDVVEKKNLSNSGATRELARYPSKNKKAEDLFVSDRREKKSKHPQVDASKSKARHHRGHEKHTSCCKRTTSKDSRKSEKRPLQAVERTRGEAKTKKRRRISTGSRGSDLFGAKSFGEDVSFNF